MKILNIGKIQFARKLFRPSLPLVLFALILLSVPGCSDRKSDTAQLLNAGIDAGRSGNWALAEQNAVSVLKHDPDDPYAALLRAIAAEHLGQEDVALNTIRPAAERMPDDFAIQYTLGRLLAKRPEYVKEAIQPLERALRANPGERNALLLLGQCSSAINADNAIDYYLALPKELQARPEIQTKIAIYYLDRRNNPKENNLDKAQTALINAYKVSPDNPGIVLNLALFLDYYTTSKNKAAGFYERYLKLTEHNPELNQTRAQIKSRLSDPALGSNAKNKRK